MSKQKGKWMGGMVPTGYECRDHKLFVYGEDATLIRHIFDRYVALGSINLLKAELDAEGYRTKSRISKTGREYGGLSFILCSVLHEMRTCYKTRNFAMLPEENKCSSKKVDVYYC